MNMAAKHLRKLAEELRGRADGADREAQQYDEQAVKVRKYAEDHRARAYEYERAAEHLDPPAGPGEETAAPAAEEAA